MIHYLARRLLLLVPVLAGVSVVVFLVLNLSPGDPAQARIKNLLEQRKRLHDHFRKYGVVELEKQNISSFDQKFVQNALEVINDNLSNLNFSVEAMASDLAVSKWMLNKKLSALTGDPPAEFIKRVRLSRAAKLIEHSTGNISEIALEVGFSNPAYFAECFKKQFGISPSQYHQNNWDTN